MPADEEEREACRDAGASRRRSRGTQPVPVRAEDIGIEAVDDHTVRIRTAQPIPYLPGLMAHQFFRAGPAPGDRASTATPGPSRATSIVSGPFLLDSLEALRPHRPGAQPEVLGRATHASRADHVLRAPGSRRR